MPLLHSRLALTVILFAFAMGAWAAFLFFRGKGIDSSYWGALVIGEILMIAQGVVGLLMVLSGLRPADLLHLLYGFLVVLAWPGVYVYTNARQGRPEAGIYALVS